MTGFLKKKVSLALRQKMPLVVRRGLAIIRKLGWSLSLSLIDRSDIVALRRAGNILFGLSPHRVQQPIP